MISLIRLRSAAPLRSAQRLALSDFQSQSVRASSSSASGHAAASEADSIQTEAENATGTTHFRVTLRRSAIGLPKHTNKVLESLGLRNRLQSIYRPRRADIAGMLLAVKELVHVENVRRLDGGVTALQSGAADETQVDGVEPSVVSDRDAVWVNEAGEVVDWGGPLARKAPRGFKVVGNVSNELRHHQIQAQRAVDALGD